VIAAYSFLRKEFGERFLNQPVRGHGFNEKLFNRAPWQLEELVSIVATMKRLKDQDSNYDHLISKLKSRDKSRAEGLPILEISRMILESGFLIKIEPDIHSHKKPDLEIINPVNGDILYGELTVLNDSDDRNRKREDFDFLFESIEMVGPPIHYACRQKKFIDQSNRDSLFKFIQDCKKKVNAANSFEIFENEFFEVGFAAESKVQQLQDWIEKEELTLDKVLGLEFNYNESKRIVNNKIREKAGQIPEGSNGVLFIRINPMFFMEHWELDLIPRAHRELRKYPNVIGMVVYSLIGVHQETGIFPYQSAFLSVKQVTQLSSRFTLYVINETADLKVS
jgi:hypothetical protein